MTNMDNTVQISDLKTVACRQTISKIGEISSPVHPVLVASPVFYERLSHNLSLIN